MCARNSRAIASSVSLFPRPRIRGIITGASPKGTYVRLLKFPAEGMVVRSTHGIDVGDTVRVRLALVDVAKGFIDFERM